MSDVKLNWAEASVEGSKLTVPLAGEADDDWKESFENTVRLLGGGDWGEVKVKKQAVRVADVSRGDEEKLRHYLESVIEQANSTGHVDQEPSSDGDEQRLEGPDAEMTERFRAFGEPEQEPEGDRE